jgi:predicted anti-sigma-YlaC factor YlaD
VITSCAEIVDLVTDYLEGTLPPELRLEFERHLVACPPCRGYLMQMRGLLRVAGRLREEQLPPELREALIEHFSDWKHEHAE